jgi:putative transposase
MLVRKAYKFRIYPDAKQEELFRQTVGCCRLVYNLCLEQKSQYNCCKKSVSKFEQIKELTALKEQLDFLHDVPHHPLQQAVYDLHAGFKNMFEGRAGYPTRKKGQNDAFRYPDPKQIKLEKDRIFLPKAGWTRMVMHRPIVGKVKNVTVSTIAGDWFVSFQVEHKVAVLPVNRGAEIGIDMGGAQPIVLSDGAMPVLPRMTVDDRRKIANAHRSLARRKKGSKNREKAKRKVARLQARYARRRKDALPKATTMIVKNHGVIVIEDLKVREMTKTGKGTVENPGKLVQKQANQNRSLLDASPRMIRTMLEYKAPWYGSRIIVVDPATPRNAAALAAPSTRRAGSAGPALSAPTAGRSSTPMSTPQRTS